MKIIILSHQVMYRVGYPSGMSTKAAWTKTYESSAGDSKETEVSLICIHLYQLKGFNINIARWMLEHTKLHVH